MFQSRPITNLDSTFTSYELMHELDTPHMSEFEIYSRAHVGENYPGASSWLSMFLFTNGTNFMVSQTHFTNPFYIEYSKLNVIAETRNQ